MEDALIQELERLRAENAALKERLFRNPNPSASIPC